MATATGEFVSGVYDYGVRLLRKIVDATCWGMSPNRFCCFTRLAGGGPYWRASRSAAKAGIPVCYVGGRDG